MKEILELRVNYEYAHLLFKKSEGRDIGSSVKVIKITKDDPRYELIPIVSNEVKKKYHQSFFYGWRIIRQYSKHELRTAELFQLKIKSIFEPCGEELGTFYDEAVACNICGANADQLNNLILKPGTIPIKDISTTISGEVVVSKKFVQTIKENKLIGFNFKPIYTNGKLSDYSQLSASNEIDLSNQIVAGINPFDLSTHCENEIYKCPNGDTIGLNLLSEAVVINNKAINNTDFMKSKQKIGVRRGLLRPESIYLCSSAFKDVVEKEKLSGMCFERAVVQEK